MKDYIVYGMDELMIDGHRCKKLDQGVYETCDSYIVSKDIWENDKRNKGLFLSRLERIAQKTGLFM